MNNAVLHLQTVLVEVKGGRIADNTIASVADLRSNETVAFRGLVDHDTVPLTTHTIVGQIGEHVVETVATQRTVLHKQCAMHIKT